MQACSDWETESGATYNKDKTELLFIAKAGNIRPPVLKTDNQTHALTDFLQYLGLTIDTKLNFIEHAKRTRLKAAKTSLKLTGQISRQWGHNKEIFKNIMDRVVRPAVLYASEIWESRASNAAIKRHIEAAQRPLLLTVNRAYRTTPTAALQVLAGSPPWWIEARATHIDWTTNATDIDKTRIKTIDKPHPCARHAIRHDMSRNETTRTIIHTDASVGEDGQTGIGLNIKHTDGREENLTIRTTKLDTHQAELAAIKMALTKTINVQDVTIVTDRKGALDAIRDYRLTNTLVCHTLRDIEDRTRTDKTTRIIWKKGHSTDNLGNKKAHKLAKQAKDKPDIDIDMRQYDYKTRARRRQERTDWTNEEWQRYWDNTDKGRELHKICREVGRGRIDLTFKGTQLATGHGNTRHYIHRFRLDTGTDKCECDLDETETIDHIKYNCTNEERRDIRELTHRQYGDLDVQLRQDNITVNRQVKKHIDWAEKAIQNTLVSQ